MKLVDVWVPLGPLIEVVGVVSVRPKDSIFLVAAVESPVPPVVAVKACAVTISSRLPVMVAGIDQPRVVPLPESVAS